MTAPTQTATPKKNPHRVTTPRAVLSFPHLFAAQAGPDGGKAKFSTALVFVPDADGKPSNIDELKKAAAAVAEAKFGAQWQDGVRSGKIQWPFRNDEDKGYPKGSVFINVRSEEKPGIVSRVKGPDGKPTPITDPKEMYPGCIVRATITAFAYEFRQGGTGPVMKKGVSFGLNNIQKLDEGTRLDNRVAAEDDFEADLQPEAAAASLDDLM